MNNLLNIENLEYGQVINVESNAIITISLNKISEGCFVSIRVKQDYAKHTTDIHTNLYKNKKRCLNALNSMINSWYEKK